MDMGSPTSRVCNESFQIYLEMMLSIVPVSSKQTKTLVGILLRPVQPMCQQAELREDAC